MTKITAVDTNVLLDYRLKREPGFTKALHLINNCVLNKVRIFIPGIVFPEMEWVLRSFYKQPKDLIIEFLEDLLALEGVLTEDKPSLEQALNIFRQSNIKFTDSIILTQIQNFQPDEFLTSDQDLKKLYHKPQV